MNYTFSFKNNNNILIIIITSAVIRLIAINHIQNKSFCLHICMCAVIIYYVYINTHTCMYIFQKKTGYNINIDM